MGTPPQSAADSDNVRPNEPQGAPPGQTYHTKRARHGFADTFTILAGEEREEFVVVPRHLGGGSSFLSAAFSKEWQRTTARVVEIPLVPPFAFAMYLHWSFNKSLKQMDNDFAVPYEGESSLAPLAHLWLAADFLQDTAMQNEVMLELIRRIQRWTLQTRKAASGSTTDVEEPQPFGFSADLINHVFETTPPSSRLRALIVKTTILFMLPQTFEDIAMTATNDFAVQVAVGLFEQDKRPTNGQLDKWPSRSEKDSFLCPARR